MIAALQAKVTKTAAFNGPSFDASVLKGDYMILLRIIALHGTCRFVVADSINAFTAELPGPTCSLPGVLAPDTVPPTGAGPQEPVVYHWKKQEFAALRAGAAGNVFRLELAELKANNPDDGVTPTVTYEAWVEY